MHVVLTRCPLREAAALQLFFPTSRFYRCWGISNGWAGLWLLGSWGRAHGWRLSAFWMTMAISQHAGFCWPISWALPGCLPGYLNYRIWPSSAVLLISG